MPILQKRAKRPNALSERVAVLEERMKTMQADRTAPLESFRTDMERRDTEAAKREARMLLAVAGMTGLAVLAAGFAFPGILIGLPP